MNLRAPLSHSKGGLTKDGFFRTYRSLGQLIDKRPDILDRYSKYSTADLKKRAAKLKPSSHSPKDFAVYRLRCLGISLELSRRGIAPRWQGWRTVEDAYENRDYWQRRLDFGYYDLAWLSIELDGYPPRSTQRWKGLYSAKDASDLWRGFEAWRASGPKKLSTLDLPKGYQFGLLLYVSKDAKERLRSAEKSAEAFGRRQEKRALGVPQITKERISAAMAKWQAQKLAGPGAASLAAVLHKHMTGEALTKQAMSKFLAKAKAPLKKAKVRSSGRQPLPSTSHDK